MTLFYWLGWRFYRPVFALSSPTALVGFAGIVFSVMAILGSLAVNNGFRAAYQKALLSFHPHVTVYGGSLLLADDSLQDFLVASAPASDSAIARWNFFSYEDGLLVGPKGAAVALIKVLPDATWAGYRAHGDHAGGAISGLILGDGLLAKLQGARTTSRTRLVDLFVGHGLLAGGAAESLAAASHKIAVAGSFHAGLGEVDDRFGLLPAAEYPSVFGGAWQAQGVEIFLHDPDMAAALKEEILANVAGGFEVATWQERDRSLFEALNLERWVFFAIMIMILVIASFNLVGVLLGGIFVKRSELQILRILGATQTGLATHLKWRAFLMGMAGLVCGIVLSGVGLELLQGSRWLQLDPQVYFVPEIELTLRLDEVLGVAILVAAVLWGTTALASRLILKRVDMRLVVEGSRL